MVIVTGVAACAVARAAQNDVVINEIAWMGSTDSGTNEWMELKNTTDNQINVPGWTLSSADQKLTIHLQGQIPAQGFYLLERTADNSVPNSKADIIYKGSLSNTGEDLLLYDNLHTIVDRVNFPTAWPAGNSATKQTMEKTATGWQTSLNPNGTPKAENSTGATKTIEAATADTTYPAGLIINEILPSPEGADQDLEWIELYNTNSFAVDISGWKLQDTKGTPGTYLFPQHTTVESRGYVVAKRPTTHIMLNNDEDGVTLVSPDGKTVNTITYSNAPKNQSYNRTESGWQWSARLTPGSLNIIAASSPKTAPAPKPLSKTKKTDNKINIAAASVSEPVNFTNSSLSSTTDNRPAPNPWFLFFIALAITIISATIIIIIKLTFHKNDERTQSF